MIVAWLALKIKMTNELVTCQKEAYKQADEMQQQEQKIEFKFDGTRLVS